MAPRFVLTLVGRVREHPLAMLSGLVGISLEIATLWLLSAIWGHAAIDTHRSALGQAFGMLGFVFILPELWIAPFRLSRNEPPRENTASRGVRRAALCAWAVILVFALAQVAAALAGNRGVALPLGYAVGWLNLIAIIGGLVVRVSAAGRQR